MKNLKLKTIAFLGLFMTLVSFTQAQSQQSGDVVLTSTVPFDSLPDSIKTVVRKIYKDNSVNYDENNLKVYTGEFVMCVVGPKTHYCAQHVGQIYLIGIPKKDGWDGIEDLTVWLSLNNRFKIRNELPGWTKSKYRLNDSNYVYGVVSYEGRVITGGEGAIYPMPKNPHYNITVPEITRIEKPKKKSWFRRC